MFELRRKKGSVRSGIATAYQLDRPHTKSSTGCKAVTGEARSVCLNNKGIVSCY